MQPHHQSFTVTPLSLPSGAPHQSYHLEGHHLLCTPMASGTSPFIYFCIPTESNSCYLLECSLIVMACSYAGNYSYSSSRVQCVCPAIVHLIQLLCSDHDSQSLREEKIDNSFPSRAGHFYFIKIFTKLVSGSNLRIVLWYEKNFNC